MLDTSASLLQRLRFPSDEAAWERLVTLYNPLIRGWLRHQGVASGDCDDLTQEVLAIVVRRFPEFQHNQRTGAFRGWLRTIAVNCLRNHGRARKHLASIGPALDQLADPASELSQLWDREHDLHVARQLLALLRPQFESSTWQAFTGVALEGRPATEIAAELGITPNAVYVAKSRVLARLRQEAAGLLE